MKVIDPTKDETFILLRGKVKVSSLNDDGSIRDKLYTRNSAHNYNCYCIMTHVPHDERRKKWGEVWLSNLQAGWDGAGARPMHKKVVQNVQRVIKAGISSDFQNWVLFPDDNGTLLMQSKDGMASISIGNNSYSFVCTQDGKIKAGESVKFSPMAVLNTIRTIASV